MISFYVLSDAGRYFDDEFLINEFIKY